MGPNSNLKRARTLLSAATQLMALAHDLEAETVDEDQACHRFAPSDAILIELARQIYDARRQRFALKSCHDLFGEPAWDMLLDLFIAAHENRDVSVTSACLGSGVPPSTALRSLAVLQERGIIIREDDARDGRRTFVRISAAGFTEFSRYFRRIAHAHAAFATLKPPECPDAVVALSKKHLRD